MNHNENVPVALSDPGCLRNSTNSTQWINRNFGPFVQSAPLTDLVELNRNFTAVSVKYCNSCKISYGKKTTIIVTVNLFVNLGGCSTSFESKTTS